MPKKHRRISDLQDALRRCQQPIVAELLGLDVSTVRERIRSGEWPDAGAGRTDAFEAARVERQRQREGPGPSSRTKLIEIQTKQRELEYRRRAGELLERDEMHEAVDLALITIRTGALAMCGRAAPIVRPDDPAYAALVLKREVIEFLIDAARKLSVLGTFEDALDNPSAAPRKTSRRVGGRKTKTTKRKRGKRKV